MNAIRLDVQPDGSSVVYLPTSVTSPQRTLVLSLLDLVSRAEGIAVHTVASLPAEPTAVAHPVRRKLPKPAAKATAKAKAHKYPAVRRKPEALTEESVGKLEPRSAPYRIFDLQVRDLFIQTFPSGTRSWGTLHRDGKRKVYRKIGGWPALSLVQARALAAPLPAGPVKGPAASKPARQEKAAPAPEPPPAAAVPPVPEPPPAAASTARPAPKVTKIPSEAEWKAACAFARGDE